MTTPIDPKEAAKALADRIWLSTSSEYHVHLPIILKHFQKFTEGMEKRVKELEGELFKAKSERFKDMSEANVALMEDAKKAHDEAVKLRTERDQLTHRAKAAEYQLLHITAERDQLAQDKKRLDWLESHCSSVVAYTHDRGNSNIIKIFDTYGLPSIRDAIDTALQAQLAKGGGE